MLARQSYVKYDPLMLVQGNVRRVKKLGIVIGESGCSHWAKWVWFEHISLKSYLSKITIQCITLLLAGPSKSTRE